MVDFKKLLAERRAKAAEEFLASKEKQQPIISDDDLDHTPLTFGKYKGKTPNQVAEMGNDGEEYIVWMFKEVRNKPTCSALLAKECGYVDWTEKNLPPSQLHDGYGRTNPSTGFDDLDDDIPF